MVFPFPVVAIGGYIELPFPAGAAGGVFEGSFVFCIQIKGDVLYIVRHEYCKLARKGSTYTRLRCLIESEQVRAQPKGRGIRVEDSRNVGEDLRSRYVSCVSCRECQPDILQHIPTNW